MIKKSLISFLLLALCGSHQAHASPFGGDMVVLVHAAEVMEEEVPLYIEVIGTLDSPLTVELHAQVSGRLVRVHVPEGIEVKKGELLFTIDSAPFRAHVNLARTALEKTKASLAFAKKKYERYAALAKQEYVSQLDHDQYQNDVETLTAQTLNDAASLELAEINLAYCSIRAPMDGRLSECARDPGTLVGPNDAIPLTCIRQLDPIDVRFNLAQQDFQAIKASHRDMNLPLEIILPGESEPSFKGRLYFIDNHLDLNTGTILCKGALANGDRALWPGEFVRVRLETKRLPQALLVPFEAVQLGQQGAYVYVIKPDMSVDLRPIVVEAHHGAYAILTSGLKRGEQVVTNGQINLRPGSKVKVETPLEESKKI